MKKPLFEPIPAFLPVEELTGHDPVARASPGVPSHDPDHNNMALLPVNSDPNQPHSYGTKNYISPRAGRGDGPTLTPLPKIAPGIDTKR